MGLSGGAVGGWWRALWDRLTGAEERRRRAREQALQELAGEEAGPPVASAAEAMEAMRSRARSAAPAAPEEPAPEDEGPADLRRRWQASARPRTSNEALREFGRTKGSS